MTMVLVKTIGALLIGGAVGWYLAYRADQADLKDEFGCAIPKRRSEQ